MSFLRYFDDCLLNEKLCLLGSLRDDVELAVQGQNVTVVSPTETVHVPELVGLCFSCVGC